jgi:hypothetical protein
MKTAFMDGTVIIGDDTLIENGVVIVEKDKIIKVAEGKTAKW